MSPSSASAGSASSDVQTLASSAARTLKASRATARAVAARFSGHAVPVPGWVRVGVWVSTFLASPASRGEASVATPGLLGWVGDDTWEVLARQLTFGPPPVAVVTGGRYLSIAGVNGAYDLDEDRPISILPSDWVESRVFNLRSVYRASRTQEQ